MRVCKREREKREKVRDTHTHRQRKRKRKKERQKTVRKNSESLTGALFTCCQRHARVEVGDSRHCPTLATGFLATCLSLYLSVLCLIASLAQVCVTPPLAAGCVRLGISKVLP